MFRLSALVYGYSVRCARIVGVMCRPTFSWSGINKFMYMWMENYEIFCFALTIIQHGSLPIRSIYWWCWLKTQLSKQLPGISMNFQKNYPRNFASANNKYAKPFAIREDFYQEFLMNKLGLDLHKNGYGKQRIFCGRKNGGDGIMCFLFLAQFSLYLENGFCTNKLLMSILIFCQSPQHCLEINLNPNLECRTEFNICAGTVSISSIFPHRRYIEDRRAVETDYFGHGKNQIMWQNLFEYNLSYLNTMCRNQFIFFCVLHFANPPNDGVLFPAQLEILDAMVADERTMRHRPLLEHNQQILFTRSDGLKFPHLASSTHSIYS